METPAMGVVELVVMEEQGGKVEEESAADDVGWNREGVGWSGEGVGLGNG